MRPKEVLDAAAHLQPVARHVSRPDQLRRVSALQPMIEDGDRHLAEFLGISIAGASLCRMNLHREMKAFDAIDKFQRDERAEYEVVPL